MGHRRVRTTPNASPARDLLAWSPPPARALIAPAPRDLPPTSRRFVTLRLLPSSGPPPVRELPPGGSPVSLPLQPGPPDQRPSAVSENRIPHPTRFQSSVRGARAGRGVHRHRYFPVGGFSPPFRTRAMRGQGFPLPLPPVPPPPSAAWGLTAQPVVRPHDRHPASRRRPQRCASGAPAGGFRFPHPPAAG